jgi:hypothetical protein
LAFPPHQAVKAGVNITSLNAGARPAKAKARGMRLGRPNAQAFRRGGRADKNAPAVFEVAQGLSFQPFANICYAASRVFLIHFNARESTCALNCFLRIPFSLFIIVVPCCGAFCFICFAYLVC